MSPDIISVGIEEEECQHDYDSNTACWCSKCKTCGLVYYCLEHEVKMTQFNKKLDDIVKFSEEAIEIIDNHDDIDNNYHMFAHSKTSRLEELLHKIKQKATYK